MTRDDITLLMSVEFDTDLGRESGVVIGIMRDIGTGEGYAVVEVDHALPGCMRHVAISQLERKGARK